MHKIICNSLAILILANFLVVEVFGKYHNFEEDITLSSKEEEILSEFKTQALVENLPHSYMQKDIFLVKWLRSQNFDMAKTEAELFKMLKWRDNWKMDGISEENWDDFEEYKYWVEGSDRRGKPILYFDAETHDTRKIVLAGKGDRYLRYIAKAYEETCSLTRELGEEFHNVTRSHLIMNMKGYNIVSHGCVQCISFVLRMINMYQQNWPGCVDQIIMVNTPAVFEFLLNAAKTVMTPELKESIQVFGVNKDQWKKVLSKEFDFDQLPPTIGGSKLYKGMEDYYSNTL